MKVKFNNIDTLNLNKKWFKIILLVLGLLLTFAGLVQLYFNALSPEGNEKVSQVVGNQHIRNLIIGPLFLLSYYLIKNSTSKNPI